MGDKTTTQLGCVLMSMIQVTPASTLRKEGEGAKREGEGEGSCLLKLEVKGRVGEGTREKWVQVEGHMRGRSSRQRVTRGRERD
jgi:hypothetical protein